MNIRSAINLIKSFGLRKCLFNAFSVLISDVCVVSYMRCGQTWLRMMFIKALCLKYGFKTNSLETQFMALFKSAPNVFFTHAGSTEVLKPEGSRFFDKQISRFIKMYRGKKIILLVRDPKDLMVSLYHDHTKRRVCYQGTISEFIRNKDLGIEKPISFMNAWAEEMEKRKDDFLIVRYEDLKKDTDKELRKIFDFLKLNISKEIISEAIEFGSFENMRKMELEGLYKDHRMLPVNTKDINSYRARKGKVGSYKEELCKKDINCIKDYTSNKLNPIFGYK